MSDEQPPVSSGALPERFSFEITVDAAACDVWRALSEGAELQRWFPISARVKPGLGGSVFLSWGPMCEGEAPITLWEPGRAMAWTETHEGGAVEITGMFEVISQKDDAASTVVRVTQSGFGKGAKWADYYDSISSGWKFELRSLRHYLTLHRGKDRQCVWVPVAPPTPMGQSAIWSRLWRTGGDGLCASGSISGLNEGDAYALVGPDGSHYSGTVLRHVPERMFAGVVRELDDALMRIELEPGGVIPHSDQRAFTPMFWLSIWGRKGPLAERIGTLWSERMAATLKS